MSANIDFLYFVLLLCIIAEYFSKNLPFLFIRTGYLEAQPVFRMYSWLKSSMLKFIMLERLIRHVSRVHHDIWVKIEEQILEPNSLFPWKHTVYVGKHFSLIASIEVVNFFLIPC